MDTHQIRIYNLTHSQKTSVLFTMQLYFTRKIKQLNNLARPSNELCADTSSFSAFIRKTTFLLVEKKEKFVRKNEGKIQKKTAVSNK